MFLSDAGEYAVPVRATKVRRRAERGDGVLFGADVLHEYVCHVVVLDLGSQVYVDFDAVLHILLFDRVQERVEPLGGAKVADHPCKVDLCVQFFFVIPERERTWEGTAYFGEACRLGVVEVVHAVPDRLEDPIDHQQNTIVRFF